MSAICTLKDSLLQISYTLERLNENEVLQENMCCLPSITLVTIIQRRYTIFDSEFKTYQWATQKCSNDNEDDDAFLVMS